MSDIHARLTETAGKSIPEVLRVLVGSIWGATRKYLGRYQEVFGVCRINSQQKIVPFAKELRSQRWGLCIPRESDTHVESVPSQFGM